MKKSVLILVLSLLCVGSTKEVSTNRIVEFSSSKNATSEDEGIMEKDLPSLRNQHESILSSDKSTDVGCDPGIGENGVVGNPNNNDVDLPEDAKEEPKHVDEDREQNSGSYVDQILNKIYQLQRLPYGCFTSLYNLVYPLLSTGKSTVKASVMRIPYEIVVFVQKLVSITIAQRLHSKLARPTQPLISWILLGAVFFYLVPSLLQSVANLCMILADLDSWLFVLIVSVVLGITACILLFFLQLVFWLIGFALVTLVYVVSFAFCKEAMVLGVVILSVNRFRL
ncbi:unnamed protein product [Clavelina lepadiformis]|uniref:Uncharacterized protein n=1 Tax=Clavelina lepadiformis TaxID=159417 RepID=A0ABP0G8J3_CLALP